MSGTTRYWSNFVKNNNTNFRSPVVTHGTTKICNNTKFNIHHTSRIRQEILYFFILLRNAELQQRCFSKSKKLECPFSYLLFLLCCSGRNATMKSLSTGWSRVATIRWTKVCKDIKYATFMKFSACVQLWQSWNLSASERQPRIFFS